MEHLTQKQVEDYSRQQLPASELLAVTDHLGRCDVCRARIQSAGNGEAAFFSLRSQTFDDAPQTVEHLTMDQTAAYVDRSLSGEELQFVTDHLLHCEQCNLATEDLREFRNEIAPSLDRDLQPASVPSPAESSWRKTLRSLTAPFRVSPVPAFGGALAILLLAVIAWIVWRTPQQPEPQIAIAPSPQSTAPPQADSSPIEPQPAPVVAQLNDGATVLT
ncbi:MAG TPA: zf-HC2 domain-containing protein, partial [Pyrinomonadaceae bacterium]|nr:zf-HC2 domain-containing protein [Pyrinomonadaceae bacterium]